MQNSKPPTNNEDNIREPHNILSKNKNQDHTRENYSVEGKSEPRYHKYQKANQHSPPLLE